MLSEIAFRSKAHWGYSAEFMDACRTELSVTPQELERNPAFVLVQKSTPIGFYTLERLSSAKIELSHLFIDSDELGRGYESLLLEHALKEARDRGYDVLAIQSDPNAEEFYAACGARRVGLQKSASVPGRMLPLLALDLGAGLRPRRD